MKTGAIFALFAMAAVLSAGHGRAQVIEDELNTRQGEEFRILDAGPKDAAGAVIVIHDWFGISEMTRDAVEHLGALGYRAIAVDLFDGQTADNHADAFALMEAIDQPLANRKIAAAIDEMQARGKKVALLAFSMGSLYALRADLTRPDQVAGTVIWYGDTPEDEDRLKPLKSPLLYIAGSRDGPAADKAAELSKLGDRLGKHFEVYVYPGVAHAWAQPLYDEGDNFDAAATEASWALTEDFLQRVLGAPARPED